MFRQARDREAVYACFTFSHWLVYANSAANPIIYNFLSGEWAGEAVTGWRQSPGQQSSRPQSKPHKGWWGRRYLLLSGDYDPALGTATQGEDLAPPRSLGLSEGPATLPAVARES